MLREVMVHRKGATSAAASELGITPGTLETASQVVRGQSNADSLMSCSHGAARTMSRKATRKHVPPTEFAAPLVGTYSGPPTSILVKAPGVDNDIGTVIGRPLGMVEGVSRLRPIITLKGDSRAGADQRRAWRPGWPRGVLPCSDPDDDAPWIPTGNESAGPTVVRRFSTEGTGCGAQRIWP